MSQIKSISISCNLMNETQVPSEVVWVMSVVIGPRAHLRQVSDVGGAELRNSLIHHNWLRQVIKQEQIYNAKYEAAFGTELSWIIHRSQDKPKSPLLRYPVSRPSLFSPPVWDLQRDRGRGSHIPNTQSPELKPL